MGDIEKILGKMGVPIGSLNDLNSILANLNREGIKSMLRSRPYNGQPHTDMGKRGEQEITGITMRDLHDCFIRAVLLSAHHLVPKSYEEAEKGENARLSGGDLYGFNLDDLDPIAIAQNLTCEVERVMGIFPNVEEIDWGANK